MRVDSPTISAVVLAAGQGRRMRSARPKPLHRLCGRPMVRYVLDALEGLPMARVVVVVGNEGARLAEELADVKPVTDVVEQSLPRGTGDSVLAGLTAFVDDFETGDVDDVLVVPAEIPLLRAGTLVDLVAAHRDSGAAATVLTARGAPSESALLVVRGGRDGSVVEVLDPDGGSFEHGAESDEVASGIWCFRRSLLAPALRRVVPDATVSGEIPIAATIAVLTAAGHAVSTHEVHDADEVASVNDRVELALAEAELRRRTNEWWMARGVTMLDPLRTYIDATVELAADVTLYPGTMLQGATSIGEGADVGPDTRLVNCVVGPGSRVEKTMAESAEIGADCHVGPFAVLEKGSRLSRATVTGPFYNASEGQR